MSSLAVAGSASRPMAGPAAGRGPFPIREVAPAESSEGGGPSPLTSAEKYGYVSGGEGHAEKGKYFSRVRADLDPQDPSCFVVLLSWRTLGMRLFLSIGALPVVLGLLAGCAAEEPNLAEDMTEVKKLAP